MPIIMGVMGQPRGAPPVPPVFVNSTTILGGLSGTTTSPAIDTTGAGILIMAMSCISPGVGGGAVTVSDSKGNTWNALTPSDQSQCRSRIYYSNNPTVGLLHTFTVSGGTIGVSAWIFAYTGTQPVAPLDVQSAGAVATSTTLITPASITPTVTNDLIVTVVSNDGSATAAGISAGFTTFAFSPFSGGTREGGCAAVLVQNPAAAIAPSWSLNSAGTNLAASMAAFKA